MAMIPQPGAPATVKKVSHDSNMRFYIQLGTTDKEAQKEFNNGRFSGTDINPMWRIRKLTELFGPVGFGWYTEDVEYVTIPCTTGEVAVICTLKLYVKDPVSGQWSMPAHGVGGNQLVMMTKAGLRLNDEGHKMAYTDAFGIACKALGMSADIYFKNDRTKYILATELAKENDAPPGTVKLPEEITKAEVVSWINAFKAEIGKAYGNPNLFDSARALLIAENKVSNKGAFELTRSELQDMFDKIKAKIEEGKACHPDMK